MSLSAPVRPRSSNRARRGSPDPAARAGRGSPDPAAPGRGQETHAQRGAQRASSKTSYLSDPQVELMLRVQRDEPGAFAELAASHGPRIFSRFYRSFRDRQDAEDLTQEVLLRVYRSRKRYEPRAKFSTWLFRYITQNVARNAFRDRRRQVNPATALDRLQQGFLNRPEAEVISPAYALERLERAHAVRAAVSGLAGHQRTALEMHQFQNRSYAEIAADLALSTKAIKSLLYRARLQLRGFLARLRDG